MMTLVVESIQLCDIINRMELNKVEICFDYEEKHGGDCLNRAGPLQQDLTNTIVI